MDSTQNPNIRTRSTLSDVADMVGVSTSTVSLVLTGKSASRRISQETRDRVLEAAAKVGYTPNLLHRSLRRGRTHIISLYNAFRNREWSDLYMDRVAAAVEHAGGAFGYDVLVHCNFNRDTQQTYESLNGGLSDGLILFGPAPNEPLLPLFRQSTLPTVLIGPRAPETVLPVINSDEDHGLQLIAEALVQSGHRRISAIVDQAAGVIDSTGRFERLQRSLADLGVKISLADTVLWEGDLHGTVDKLLHLPTRPTAVFVWHDRLAYQIVERLEAIGLNVPNDLSVVGYDGLVWPSVTSHVVTSVAVPLDEMGRAAVAVLHQIILGEPFSVRTTVPVELLKGTSLGPPKL